MGGFILNLLKDSVVNDLSFKKRNQKESYSESTSQFDFIKYKKLLLSDDHFIFQNDNGIVIGNGTISYKGLGVSDGFKELAYDVLMDKLDSTELFGHFTLIHLSDLCIKIYFDESGYGAPFVVDNRFISSSFLSCIDNLEKISLNHDAIFEELYTGCYFCGKTTFKEIRKITKKEVWNINKLMIYFIPVVQKTGIAENLNKDSSIENIINSLNLYFNRWRTIIIDQYGDLGLSSGYDSRLLLGFIENHYKNRYQVHSYWKKNKDFDNVIAEKLASVVKKKIISIPVKDKNSLSTEEFKNLLNDAMIYYDGLFPMNHGWVREYRTSSHRVKILKNSKFGLSGISGEQYRNDFNLFNKSYSQNYIIRNIILEDSNDEILEASIFHDKGIEIIKKSLKEGLNLGINSEKITRLDIQRFYCEMWVPGGPGIRNQIENNLIYFLSPFTEAINQKESQKAINDLGFGGDFQAKMIVKVHKKLSQIKSDYGFSFDNINLKYRFLWFLSAIVGRKNKIKIVMRFRSKSNNYIGSFGIHKNFIHNKIDYLEKYEFDFPIKSSKFKQDTIDRLIALSTLLQKYESKIGN